MCLLLENVGGYQIWGWMQEHVYQTLVHDTNHLKRRASHRASSTKPLTSEEYGCVHAGRQEVVTFNICSNQPVLFRDTQPHNTHSSSEAPTFSRRRHMPLVYSRPISFWRYSVCTVYLIIRPYCLQKYYNWLMSVEDIANQEVSFSRHGMTEKMSVHSIFSQQHLYQNYQHRLMCINVIACNITIVFFETQCILILYLSEYTLQWLTALDWHS